MTIRCMRIACCIPKATNTHSQYVIFTAFLLQQLSDERASILPYTHIACLVNVYTRKDCVVSFTFGPPLNTEDISSGTVWIGGCVDPRVGLDISDKSLALVGNQTQDHLHFCQITKFNRSFTSLMHWDICTGGCITEKFSIINNMQYVGRVWDCLVWSPVITVLGVTRAHPSGIRSFRSGSCAGRVLLPQLTCPVARQLLDT
jgi:hypothetical protein